MARPYLRGPLLSCAGAFAVALFALSCGNPNEPGPVPGGVVEGDYVLRIEPASGCSSPTARFTLPADATVADTSRYKGISVVSTEAGIPTLGIEIPIVEIELQYVTPNVAGGVATTRLGVAADEGYQLWVKGIARGSVMSEPGKNGEIADGTLAGDLDFGRDEDDQGELGSCSSLQHRWSLKLR